MRGTWLITYNFVIETRNVTQAMHMRSYGEREDRMHRRLRAITSISAISNGKVDLYLFVRLLRSQPYAPTIPVCFTTLA